MLPLAKEGDWCVFILEGFPLKLVESSSGPLTVCANSVEAGTIFAMVEGDARTDLRSGAGCIGTCDCDVPLVEMPVSKFTTRAALSVPIKPRGDFNGACIAEHGGWGDVVRKGRERVEQSGRRVRDSLGGQG